MKENKVEILKRGSNYIIFNIFHSILTFLPYDISVTQKQQGKEQTKNIKKGSDQKIY